MKKATTLQEPLKPPFVKYGNSIIDGKGIKILTVNGLIDSFIGNIGDNYSDILTVTAAALNEKWERGFGSPKRWIAGEDSISEFVACPACGAKRLRASNYCSDCGQRLLPHY